MRIQITKNLALLASFEPGYQEFWRQTQHGGKTDAKAWPWWRFAMLIPYSTYACPPSAGWNVWLYTRKGALLWHVALDRRSQEQRGFK